LFLKNLSNIAMPARGYDSENEDQPREVLDLTRDFTLKDSSIRFKLWEFNPTLPDGTPFPPGSVLFSLHPVPDAATVSLVKAAMGNGVDGTWTGTVFDAPEGFTPEDVFAVRKVNAAGPRDLERLCIRRRHVPTISDLKTMFIYTDGACLSNGQDAPRGGFAFVFNNSGSGTCSGALEQRSADDQIHGHTNNRAELRAVIAALRFRIWWGEGWRRVVVVTDSEYVGKGATTWLRNWSSRGWRTAAGRHVANRDLWDALSEVMGEMANGGCEISFWMVPRRFNTRADAAAKEACLLSSPESYVAARP
jgi:ribonuclease HI